MAVRFVDNVETIPGNLSVTGVISSINGTSTDWNNAVTSVQLITGNYTTKEFTDFKYLALSGGTVVGKLGVGTFQPNEKLTVIGNICATNTIYDISGNSTQWNDAFNIASNYSLISGSFVTNTVLNTVSSELTPASTFTNYQTKVANTTATLLPTSIYQNASGNWENTFTTVRNNSAQWVVDSTTDTGVRAITGNWQNTYTTVRNSSANYILDGGNTKGSNLLIGTSDNFNLTLETNNSPRITILNSGNVGIGTSSPDSLLEIKSARSELKISSSENDPLTNHCGRILFENTNINDTYDAAAIEIHGEDDAARNGSISFLTNPNGVTTPNGLLDRMIINSSGNVGIGTTNPEQRLTVSGGISALEVVFATQRVTTDELRCRTGQQVVINAGESASFATGQTAELVYINAEGGLQINSSPDNWDSGWAGRKTATICTGSTGSSTFPGPVNVTGNIGATGSIDAGTQFLGRDADTVSAPSFSWTGDPNTGMYRPAADTLGLVTNSNERIRINSSGNVGIGTTTPNERLTVSGNISATGTVTLNDNLYIRDANTAAYAVFNVFDGTGTGIDPILDIDVKGGGSNTAHTVRFFRDANTTGDVAVQFFRGNGTTNTGALINTSGGNSYFNNYGGNVGIGTVSPNSKLTVVGEISATNTIRTSGNFSSVRGSSDFNVLNLENTGGVQVQLNANGNTEGNLRTVSNHPLTFSTNNTEKARIATNGDVGIGTTDPESKLDVRGNILFGRRANFGKQPGYLSNTWTNNENYKFFTLGSSYFDGSNWITNLNGNFGSNNIALIAGDTQGIKFYTQNTSGNTQRTESTSTFNTYERMRIGKAFDQASVVVGYTARDSVLSLSKSLADETNPVNQGGPGPIPRGRTTNSIDGSLSQVIGQAEYQALVVQRGTRTNPINQSSPNTSQYSAGEPCATFAKFTNATYGNGGISLQFQNPALYCLGVNSSQSPNSRVQGVFSEAMCTKGPGYSNNNSPTPETMIGAFVEGGRFHGVTKNQTAPNSEQGGSPQGIVCKSILWGYAQFSIGVESELQVVRNNRVNAPAPRSFNPIQFDAAYLATIRSPSETADVAYLVNPWNSGRFQGGFVVGNGNNATILATPEPNGAAQGGGPIASTGAAFACYQGAQIQYGLDLAKGSYSQAAIAIPNNTPVRAYNQAGNSELNMIYVNASNSVVIGADAGVSNIVLYRDAYTSGGSLVTSDLRTKTDIQPTVLGLDFINKLNPVSYKKINRNHVPFPIIDDIPPEPGQRTHFGLIAQEVKTALPEGVDFGGWALLDKDDPDSQQALRYDQFIAPLIKAVQELTTQNKALSAELQQLKEAIAN